MMRKERILAVTVGMVAAGCIATSEAFSPTEHVEGTTIEGYREAFYDLTLGEARAGEVKVWSRGAFTPDRDEPRQTIVHVGFTVENGSDEPMVLDSSVLELDQVQLERGIVKKVPVSAIVGATTIRPKSIGEAEATFMLPNGIRPSDVIGFRLQWTVRSGDDEFTEFTPFMQYEPQYAYVPVYSYYHPYDLGYPYSTFGPRWAQRRVEIVRPYPRRVNVYRRHRVAR